MDASETLKDALCRIGDREEVSLLNDQAQNLTKADVTDFLNNNINHDLSLGTMHSLRKLAKQRIKEGKSVFPWNKMEDVEHNKADDSMGGGTW
jgi:hypothetical protein